MPRIRLPALVLAGAAALASAWATVTARRHRRASQLAQHQLAALTGAIGSLARTSAPDDFLANAIRTIAEQLGARWVMLFLRDPVQDVLEVHLVFKDGQIVPRERATPNLAHPIPTRDVPIWADLERTRRPIHVADIRTDTRLRQRDALLAQGVRSMLVVPLIVGDSLIGWFSVRNTDPQDYRSDQLDLATALAQQAALAGQLTRLGAQGRQAAVLEERNRMAREIHDTLAQGFTGILMQLEATESALDSARPDLAHERLAKARELARASLSEARRSVWALRPQALEQQPFVAALRAAATTLTSDAAIHLSFAVEGTVGYIPTELETDLLRVAQEAIINSVKHATAQNVHVRVRDDSQSLAVHIRDDGRGFERWTPHEQDGSGFGLTAMRERLERHGGRLMIQSAPGHGTEIIAHVERHNLQRTHLGELDKEQL
jgi:signal transduction histidine kinase